MFEAGYPRIFGPKAALKAGLIVAKSSDAREEAASRWRKYSAAAEADLALAPSTLEE